MKLSSTHDGHGFEEIHEAAGHKYVFRDDGSTGRDGTAFHLEVFRLDVELREGGEDDEYGDQGLVTALLYSDRVGRLLADLEGLGDA